MELARDFLGLLFGDGLSRATLDDGLLSAQLCLMAKRSCETSQFQHYTPMHEANGDTRGRFEPMETARGSRA
jgi:hypothetical protein